MNGVSAVKNILKAAAVAVCAVGLLSGCATTGTTTANNPKDPWEGFNRAMFSFNEGLDTAVIKPVAQGYEYVTPTPVNDGITNFFANIADVFIGVNNLLQGKPGDAASDLGRFLINSTLGVLGFFDVASHGGFEKHEEDFGQTFGKWGMGPGPYVVLPVFGPRTLRDTGGLIVDTAVDPVSHVRNVPTRNSLLALRIVDTRADLLPADKVIEAAALDKYSYLRDAYLQRRQRAVYDGRPPKEADDE